MGHVKPAKDTIEDWRINYNAARPRGSLNQLTPAEFVNTVEVGNCLLDVD